MEALLKTLSDEKKELTRPDNGELSPTQTEAPDMNELIEAMLPQFLAQPAASAFLTLQNDGGPASPRSPTMKTVKSIWAPDGRVGFLLRQLLLAALVLSLLRLGVSTTAAPEWETRGLQESALVELPYVGSLVRQHSLGN